MSSPEADGPYMAPWVTTAEGYQIAENNINRMISIGRADLAHDIARNRDLAIRMFANIGTSAIEEYLQGEAKND